jgi:hypothetical protein
MSHGVVGGLLGLTIAWNSTVGAEDLNGDDGMKQEDDIGAQGYS